MFKLNRNWAKGNLPLSASKVWKQEWINLVNVTSLGV